MKKVSKKVFIVTLLYISVISMSVTASSSESGTLGGLSAQGNVYISSGEHLLIQ